MIREPSQREKDLRRELQDLQRAYQLLAEPIVAEISKEMAINPGRTVIVGVDLAQPGADRTVQIPVRR